MTDLHYNCSRFNKAFSMRERFFLFFKRGHWFGEDGVYFYVKTWGAKTYILRDVEILEREN